MMSGIFVPHFRHINITECNIFVEKYCMLLYHFRRLKPYRLGYDRQETSKITFILDPRWHSGLNLLYSFELKFDYFDMNFIFYKSDYHNMI